MLLGNPPHMCTGALVELWIGTILSSAMLICFLNTEAFISAYFCFRINSFLFSKGESHVCGIILQYHTVILAVLKTNACKQFVNKI